MSARPALKLDTGGTLRVRVSEPGAITAATVSIFRGNSTTAVVDAASATYSAAPWLSYAVTSGTANATGIYTARWSYTIDSVVYEREQTFEVVRHVLRPTLTTGDLTTSYYPMLAGRVSSTHEALLDTAWGILLTWLRHRGIKEPHLITDPLQLEPAHAALAASLIIRNFGPGADWPTMADAAFAQAQSLLDLTLATLDIDSGDDGHLSASETAQRTRRIRLSR